MMRVAIAVAAAAWLCVLWMNLTAGPTVLRGNPAVIDWGTPAVKWDADVNAEATR